MKIILVGIFTVAILHVRDSSSFTKDDFMHVPNEFEISAALNKAREINLRERHKPLFGRGYNTSRGVLCPLSYHHGISENDGAGLAAENKANEALLAIRILMTDGRYSIRDLQKKSAREIFQRFKGFSCDIPKARRCDFFSKYRTADGSCNNIVHPEWGMTGSIQQRVLPNDYDDNLGTPRTRGFQNHALPNPRIVSNVVHSNPFFTEALNTKHSLLVMGFGQFLDHDTVLTTTQKTVDDCCDVRSRGDLDNCFNIIIPTLEEMSSIFFPGYCMEVKRSAPVFCPDAQSYGWAVRQQTNSLTSFVDASQVYGSSAKKQAELRENGNGFRIKTTIFQQQERILDGPGNTCILTNASQNCSAAGERRVNELPILTSIQFLFVLEHNRLAEYLKAYCNDTEIIFQETRRIVIAVMQKIVYDEFLPSFMSPTGLRKYDIQSSANYVYEANTDPTMTNAFGIAYRVGHTWIPQKMQLFSKSFQEINGTGFTRNTEDTFLNPDMTYLPNAFERLAHFLIGKQSPLTDNIIEEAVRSRLFINREAGISFDLAALNIQRGRDHGLPSYNEYRKWCGLSSVNKQWDFLGGNSGLIDHTESMRKLLEQAGYRSPLDIDLFVGGLTERNVVGGNIGPTFECILGRHFRRLKFGDRYWYQNKDAGFTRGQISAIQSYSLSKIFCNNNNFKEINWPSAFLLRDPRTACVNIPDLDLTVFTQRPSGESFVRRRTEYRTSEILENNVFTTRRVRQGAVKELEGINFTFYEEIARIIYESEKRKGNNRSLRIKIKHRT